MNKEIRVYLLDILNSIELIEEYVSGISFDDFTQDTGKQDSVCLRLAVIGESVSKLPEATIQQQPSIPWNKIVGLRNFLVHDYASVSFKRIWQTIQQDLPPLKKAIQEILENQT